jgi:alpha-L-rhamnosidase
MYRRCAGINPMPDNPGFRKIRLIPTPNYKLQRLDAEFCSPAGTYKSSWNIRDEKHLELKFSIPFGCTAELVLPFAPETIYSDSRNPMFLCVKDGVCHLTPGEYSVSYETTETLRHVLSTSNTIEELLQNSKAKEVLTRKFPQFEDTPPHMQKSSFRKLMEQFSGSSASELLRQLDLELADLT